MENGDELNKHSRFDRAPNVNPPDLSKRLGTFGFSSNNHSKKLGASHD